MNITLKKDGVELIGKEWDRFKHEVLLETDEIIKKIEQRFGPRDKIYSVISINFISQNGPVTQVNEAEKTIIINLPAYAMSKDSAYQRKLNLSHELVHTITPCSDPNKATFLDEGLATMFSEEYTGVSDSIGNNAQFKNYSIARNMVLKLLKIDNEIIKKLREKYPNKKISDYTIQEITEEMSPSIISLAQELTQSFHGNRNGV